MNTHAVNTGVVPGHSIVLDRDSTWKHVRSDYTCEFAVDPRGILLARISGWTNKPDTIVIHYRPK